MRLVAPPVLLRCSCQLQPWSGPPSTTHFTVDVPAVSWGWSRPTTFGIWSACHCLWAVCASGAPHCSPDPRSVSRWANCLEIVCARIVGALHAQHPSFHLAGGGGGNIWLLLGSTHLPWTSLLRESGPNTCSGMTDMEPGLPRHGWQRKATEPIHGLLVEGTIRPRLFPTEQALVAQKLSVGGRPFLVLSNIPFPPSSACCSFGAFGFPSAQAGVLGRRGHAMESAAARVCREAGARVSTNVLVRDLDLFAAPPRRCSSAGGRRRRSSPLSRGTNRRGYHVGVSSQTGRDPPQSLRSGAASAACSPEERASTSRASDERFRSRARNQSKVLCRIRAEGIPEE